MASLMGWGYRGKRFLVRVARGGGLGLAREEEDDEEDEDGDEWGRVSG